MNKECYNPILYLSGLSGASRFDEKIMLWMYTHKIQLSKNTVPTVNKNIVTKMSKASAGVKVMANSGDREKQPLWGVVWGQTFKQVQGSR